eukprot:gene1985-2252_t
MQEVWQTGVDWDTEIPTAVQGKWIELFKEMKELNNKIEDRRVNVTFIAAKSRVAPLKQLTIRRLELQVAVLASRLAKSIQEESRIEFKDVKFFTDSSIALAWIQSPSRNCKPFVSSRIGEIQSNSNPSQWRHIPSADNVADDLSRGIHVDELNGRWMQGPDFLQLEEELWPTKYGPPPTEEDNECRQATKVHMVINARAENVIDYERFSSWTRLIRVTAWIKRLAENIRQGKRNQTRHNGPLTPEELQKAGMFLIKDAQNNLHDRLKRGEFKSLSPFTDDKEIIRVGGRVDKAIVSYETRHPALLPNDHRISLLITRYVHQHGHTGVATTTAKIRRKYWILQGNKISKSVKFKCVFCRELAHKAEEQQMANLPSLRLTRKHHRSTTQPVPISDPTIKGINWIFITPAAPHQNGCAEALVKSNKRALKSAIGEQVLRPFELYTCLLKVANLLNQRPIGRIPNDPDAGTYLCPNDLLLGRATSEVPQGPFQETKDPRQRVEFIQQIVNSFWKRWTRDVFPSLVPQEKWHMDRRNVQPDDTVIVAENNAIRATGEYSRPVTKIAVISPVEGYD